MNDVILIFLKTRYINIRITFNYYNNFNIFIETILLIIIDHINSGFIEFVFVLINPDTKGIYNFF